jgi:excisionase family DNA binding protein
VSTEDRPSLTVADVANFLHVSTATIYRAIKAGDLVAAKLGYRTIRISPEAVTAYLAKRIRSQYPDA